MGKAAYTHKHTHTNTIIHTAAVKVRVWMCCTKCSHVNIFRQLCFQFDLLYEGKKNNNNI